jgi:S1-C subfamily serine protease
VAVRSDGTTAVRIARAWLHPRWRPGSLEHDVALLQLEGRPSMAPLRLGDVTAIERLRRGVPVATFGFPAVSTDPSRPRGRLAVDVVGDVRLPYVEVGLSIAPGTSGSPVFDQTGTVVGLVVGGDFVDDVDGRGKRPTGSAANWVIVATEVRELLSLPR